MAAGVGISILVVGDAGDKECSERGVYYMITILEWLLTGLVISIQLALLLLFVYIAIKLIKEEKEEDRGKNGL